MVDGVKQFSRSTYAIAHSDGATGADVPENNVDPRCPDIGTTLATLSGLPVKEAREEQGHQKDIRDPVSCSHLCRNSYSAGRGWRGRIHRN